MPRSKVLATVIDAISKVSRRPHPVTGRTRPVEDCGLKSADGIELADVLEEVLGIEIPMEQNPLFEEVGRKKKTRTVDGIVDWLTNLEKDSK